MEPKGRKHLPHYQRLGQGALLCQLIVESLSVLVFYLTPIPALAVLFNACVREDLPFDLVWKDDDTAGRDSSDVEKPAEIDSVSSKIGFYIDSKLDCGISTLDWFIYSNEGTRVLEQHKRLTIEEEGFVGKNEWSSVEVKTASKSPRTVVAIANCPRAFNLKALKQKDSMDLLEYAFSDDNPESPILSGESVFIPGETETVKLSPLLSVVRVSAVSNGLDDYELLEDPSVRLCELAKSARVLQIDEFRPKESISEGPLYKLPTDVGFYTQYPDISLYCYPNDTPETTLGVPHTSLEFNCRIEGRHCSFPFDLPPIGRGEVIDVEIIINGANDSDIRIKTL